MPSEWYYETAGTPTGPVSGRQLKQLADEGVITLRTRVRKNADGQWVRAANVRGLFPENEPPLTVSNPIAEAVKRFEVPAGYEYFLFCLPAFYVAKADGSISFKEAISIAFNSIRLGLVKQRGDEHKVFNAFCQNRLREFMGKTSFDDFTILAAAINTKLDQYPEDEARRIRDSIHEMCTKVAKASGPLFGDKVSAAERQMLDRIFAEVL